MLTAIGKCTVSNKQYTLCVKSYANKTEYILANFYNAEDIANMQNGIQPVHSPVIYPADFKRTDILTCIEEIYVQGKKTPDAKYGNSAVIETVLNLIATSKAVQFDPSEIVQDKQLTVGAINRTIFEAVKPDIHIKYSYVDGLLESISIKCNDFSLNLEPTNSRVNLPDVELTEVSSLISSRVAELTVGTIHMSDLYATSDMSWYIKDGVYLKDYKVVQNITEFKEYFLKPLVSVLEKATRDNPAVVGFDTETTGLNIKNIANKDRIVTAQFSWADDQGVILFFDMEFFDNVDKKYCLSVIQEIFKEDAKGIEIDGVYHFLDRKAYILTGHNVMFDGAVFYSEGYPIYIDDDTLQMAFNLDPKQVRGNNKLKVLTRKFYKHETPELEDILGKNNADKFRMLVDKEVASVYGCADSDYARKLLFTLKKLMGPELYNMYKKQDSLLENILPVSEYYGMTADLENVRILGEEVKGNINILENFVKSYVGAIYDLQSKTFALKVKYDAGELTAEQLEQELNSITVNNDAFVDFKFTPANLSNIIYNVLHYKKFAFSTKDPTKPKLDKYVLKKMIAVPKSPNSKVRGINYDILSYGTTREEYEFLLKNDPKEAASRVLISKELFNSKEYPIALVLQKHSELNKEYTAYYKPMLEDNTEGRLFKNYNMARIETRRISNPGQTMKGKLKKFIKPYNDDYYLLDFDMSQAEYRVMVSLAGYTELIERMRDPEKDYHTETASEVHGIPAYKVTKDIRKKTKCLGFGIPYGLGRQSLCETMFGSITNANLVETDKLLAKWQAGNAPVMDLLNTARYNALQEWEISDEMRDYLGAWEKEMVTNDKGQVVVKKDSLGLPVYKLDSNGNKIPSRVSRAQSAYGFYRVFDLSKVGMSDEDIRRRESGRFNGPESTIRRAAGNYGIQSFAAELFRIILMRFYKGCEDRGYHHGDKIIWHMLIHDELLCSVHKSIHPFEIYKIAKEACMITMKNHTNYFIGINIGNSWGECKDDAREAPVLMVKDIVDRWDNGEFSLENTPEQFKRDGHYWFDQPMDFIQPYMDQFFLNRIHQVLQQLQPDIDDAPIKADVILENFDNYTVRAYVSNYPKYVKVNKENFLLSHTTTGEPVYDMDAFSNAEWFASLLTWSELYYGKVKSYVSGDGEVIEPVKNVTNTVQKSTIFTPALFTDNADPDENSDVLADILEDILEDDIEFYLSDSDSYEEPVQEEKPSLKHVAIRQNQLFITIKSSRQLAAVKQYLEPYKGGNGYLCKFKISTSLINAGFINKNIPVYDLDKYIDSLS